MVQYETQILMEILKHIPSIALEETDDKTALIKRVLQKAITSTAFKSVFSHHTSSLEADDSDIEALASHLLIIAGYVTLKKPIIEHHMMISKTGDIKPFETEVNQIEIHWIKTKQDTIQCEMRFLDGSIEIIDDNVIETKDRLV